MTLTAISLVVGFVLGAVRALELRRLGGRIEVINVVVVSASATETSKSIRPT